MKHHYAHNLLLKRTEAGLTQRDLAYLLGCNQAHVCQLEAGTRQANEREICSLCVIYNTTATDLYRVTTNSVLGAILRRIKSMPGCSSSWRERERRTKMLDDLMKRLEAYQNGIYA